MQDDELLDAILAEPDRDDLRLVYADLLAERGNPRGELIHVQVELARLDDDDPAWLPLRRRELTLLAEGRRWLRLLGPGVTGTLRRGFIEEIAGDGEAVLAAATAVELREPVLALTAVGVDHAAVAALGACAAAARIRRLALAGIPELSAADLDAMGRSPHLGAVRHLDLGQLAVHTPAILALLATPLARRLTGLELERGALGQAALDALFGGGMTQLERLRVPVPDGRLGGDLLARMQLPALRALVLPQSLLDHEAIELLAPALPPLEELGFPSNPQLGAAAMATLAACPALRGLRRLDLSHGRLGPAGTTALAGGFPQLEALSLRSCLVEPAILATARWPALRTLRAGSWTPDQLRQLGAAAWPALRTLELFTATNADQAAALADGAGFRGLTTLRCARAAIDDAAVATLAAGSWPALHTLDLRGGRALGDAAARALAASAGLPSLIALDVRGNQIGGDALAALRARFGPGVIADAPA